jgi:hypothetical protein
MVDKRYSPTDMLIDEAAFQSLFNQLYAQFGDRYEIYVRNTDFGRSISAGIVNRQTGIAVTICLKSGGVDVSNPIDPIVVQKVEHHLDSAATQDLPINFPE